MVLRAGYLVGSTEASIRIGKQEAFHEYNPLVQIITAARGEGKVFAEEMSATEDTVADESDNDDALERVETLQLRIQEHKHEKRNAKSLMTRLLNKLAGLKSDESSQKNEVNQLMIRIEEQKDETLRIMKQLQGASRLAHFWLH